MTLSRFCLLALSAALTVSAASAHADTFTTGNFYSGDQNNFSNGYMNITLNGTSYTDAAGNFSGSTGVIGGKAVSFTEVYCVDLYDTLNLNKTYTATYNTTGSVKGAAVNNAGQIAWLLLNEGPSVNSTAANEALQAAIWKEEYGSAFSLSSNNNATVISDYNADLAALGSKTAAVSSVEWITPLNSDNSYAQAQVGLLLTPITGGSTPVTPTPEPSSLMLLGTGLAGAAGMLRRRARA